MKFELSLLGFLSTTGLVSASSERSLRGGQITPTKNLNQTMDIYVLAYSWQPEFCYGKTGYYGCSNPSPTWNTNFTLHGLWPQYSTGGYPSYCTSEAFNPAVPDQVGWNDMTTYWPNAQYPTTDPAYDDFWDHEWTKHG